MSVNLVNLVMDQLGNQAMGQIGSLLGEPEDLTTSAVNAAIPALLGSLMGSSAKPQGAEGLLSALTGLDDGILGTFSNVLGGQKDTIVAEKALIRRSSNGAFVLLA